MATETEIVVTGLGVVSPLGLGTEAFWSGLMAPRSGVRPLTLFDASALPAPFGGEVPDFDPKPFVQPRKALKVMSRDIQLAYVAAKLAADQAKIVPGEVDPERLGVVFGADLMYCEVPELAPVYKACLENGVYQRTRWGTMSMRELNPLWMLKYLPNMPACHIAIALDARGPNNSLTLREVSALMALAEAIRVIERGACDMMVVGGTGAPIHPTPLVYRQGIFLSRRREEPALASRPFDAHRDGMVNGEGAAALVIETRASAERRGAPILARIACYACGAEPLDRNELLTGDSIRRVLQSVLRQTGWSAGDVAHVNARGFSTVEHDPQEAQAIADVLDDVPVIAPSAAIGNLAAGSAAVELAASILALQHKTLPPTLNYERPDAKCPIRVVHGAAQHAEHATAIKLSYTVGGQAAAIALAAE